MQNKNDNNFMENSKGHPIGHAPVEAFKNKDFFLSFIARKAEQLTTAIYLVTDTMDRVDPLRRYIRKITINLLGTSCDLRSSNAVEKSEIIVDMDTLFADLEVFIRIAKNTGNISDMNADILLSEISKCILAINTHREGEVNKLKRRDENMVASFLLDQVFSQEDLPKYLPEQTENQKDNQNSINDMKDTNVVYKDRRQKSITNKSDIAIKLLRRKTILSIIKDNKEVSLSDIKKVVNDVSEKTLQREINSLISEGIVEKKGEKRWARYSIKYNK